MKATAASTALVDIEVYNSTGQKVYQRYWDNRAFSASTTRSFSASWTVPRNLPTGTYTVKIGIFKPGWSGMYLWNNSARTFTVR